MAHVPFDVDTLLLAVFAPILGVIAFWFLQLLFIELQKRMLGRLRHKHEAFCKFTNVIGIFFQTISHALGYEVTRSGIASFHVTVNYGDVQPKKEKTGVFEWIANSFLLFGPFFIPAGLVLLASFFVIGNGFVFPAPVKFTFIESLNHFWESISMFGEAFGRFLIRMDLFNPLHLGFLLLLLFFGLGIRPSYIGEDRKSKIDMVHDLKNIKDHLVEKPLYLLVIFIVVYVLYLLSLFLGLKWYMMLFTVCGLISVTAIFAILLTYLVLLLLRATDAIATGWKSVPFITLPVSYVGARFFFLYYPYRQVEGVSLLVMILSTLTVTILLIKYKKTNRFKTAMKMKHMTVEDGKKRTSKRRAD
jgi:hypothetical protein